MISQKALHFFQKFIKLNFKALYRSFLCGTFVTNPYATIISNLVYVD